MATRYTKKARKEDPSYKRYKPAYYPVQRTFQIGPITQGPYAPVPWFLSIPRGLSEMNHRLYRRSYTYTAKIDIDNDASVDGNTVDVYVLANTWYVANAIGAARAAYDRALEEERASLNSDQQARWMDFIPSNGVSSQLLGAFASPDATAQTARDNGEHVNSRVVDANGNTKEFILRGGSSLGAWDIFEEYDKAGNPDTSPDSSGGGSYGGLKSDYNATERTHVEQDGDQPPYGASFSGVAGGNIFVKVATLNLNGTGSQRLSTGFFDAPLGYVWLSGVGSTFPSGKISCTVKAGDYKGTHALSLTEVR